MVTRLRSGRHDLASQSPGETQVRGLDETNVVDEIVQLGAAVRAWQTLISTWAATSLSRFPTPSLPWWGDLRFSKMANTDMRGAFTHGLGQLPLVVDESVSKSAGCGTRPISLYPPGNVFLVGDSRKEFAPGDSVP